MTERREAKDKTEIKKQTELQKGDLAQKWDPKSKMYILLICETSPEAFAYLVLQHILPTSKNASSNWWKELMINIKTLKDFGFTNYGISEKFSSLALSSSALKYTF